MARIDGIKYLFARAAIRRGWERPLTTALI